jgi:hypothetical protein
MSDHTKGIVYHQHLVQGSIDWLNARCGLLTASEMKHVVSPKPKMETRIKKDGLPFKQREWDPIASDEKERAHLYNLLAQRITSYVEPHYIGSDMLRGDEEEILARAAYSEKYAQITEMGFITNDKFGFNIGCSPDGLVSSDGLIECKSRRQKFQVQTIVDLEMPEEYTVQVQTALLVTERKWCDFISYCGGMPMLTLRILPDPEMQEAIILAATAFEKRLAEKFDKYIAALRSGTRLLATERVVMQEIFTS